MKDTDRILGSLQEFRDNTKAQHVSFDRRLNTIDEKIDGLYSFKWKVAGGVAATSFIISLVVSLYVAHR